jgi:hypothetical protein
MFDERKNPGTFACRSSRKSGLYFFPDLNQNWNVQTDFNKTLEY